MSELSLHMYDLTVVTREVIAQSHEAMALADFSIAKSIIIGGRNGPKQADVREQSRHRPPY